MVKSLDVINVLYARAADGLKIHGILSLVFGGLGVLCGFVFCVVIGLGLSYSVALDGFGGLVAMLVFAFVFWMIPHIYLIISGYFLIRQPAPRVAKTLVIANLVVGGFWNIVILVFAIIDLTRMKDYANGYDRRHEIHS